MASSSAPDESEQKRIPLFDEDTVTNFNNLFKQFITAMQTTYGNNNDQIRRLKNRFDVAIGFKRGYPAGKWYNTMSPLVQRFENGENIMDNKDVREGPIGNIAELYGQSQQQTQDIIKAWIRKLDKIAQKGTVNGYSAMMK